MKKRKFHEVDNNDTKYTKHQHQLQITLDELAKTKADLNIYKTTLHDILLRQTKKVRGLAVPYYYCSARQAERLMANLDNQQDNNTLKTHEKGETTLTFEEIEREARRLKRYEIKKHYIQHNPVNHWEYWFGQMNRAFDRYHPLNTSTKHPNTAGKRPFFNITFRMLRNYFHVDPLTVTEKTIIVLPPDCPLHTDEYWKGMKQDDKETITAGKLFHAKDSKQFKWSLNTETTFMDRFADRSAIPIPWSTYRQDRNKMSDAL